MIDEVTIGSVGSFRRRYLERSHGYNVLSGNNLMSLILLATRAHGATVGEVEVKDSFLAPCPSSPKCVFTKSDSENYAIAPYRYRKTPESQSDSEAGLQ